MGRFEVTCAQYRCFDPRHSNGYHDQRHKDHTTPGYPADGPNKPVIRVTWQEALAFCGWLSEKTGQKCTLPTEAQWEWACRAGRSAPFHYGTLDTDFSPFANLADRSVKRLAVSGVNPQPIANPNAYQDFLPKEGRFDDGERLMAETGRYAPNAFGLHDMHGNVWEWTRTDYRPYPYSENDGRNSLSLEVRKVVRGGSWRDRPKRARSATRLPYRTYQPVFNVGFRVVMETEASSENP
jgi:formylglycine-generating enzyme required for sulfatase activity